MDKEGLIQSALNHYWNDAHHLLSQHKYGRPLGDIEKQQLEERKKMCNELLKELDEIQPMEGYKTYRHKQNPKEKEFHDKFIEWYIDGDMTVNLIVFPPGNEHQTRAEDTLTDREKRIMITMVQWMGSPLGQSLMSECGFEPVKEKSKRVIPSVPKEERDQLNEGVEPIKHRKKLRELIDVVWNYVYEDTSVPSTSTADMLIDKIYKK